ncbi:AraC family transcriptional regulator [Phytohabitans sp. LJ34]|uniref:AraC family transcriptional regulator n=1 Tax=Phytohabitans sp. LJ34 TaxID=3452217 RepID=UPI003F8A9643
MDEVIEKAVHRVIKIMHENLSEQITVEDMARTAMFSKFHFTRIFQRVTGISPGRFLSALRIQRAKQLLLATSLNVADISHEVGYASVGTFSTRFSASVGVSPIRFRQLGGHLPGLPEEPRREPAAPTTLIRGDIFAQHTDEPGLIFVGLFPGRIPQSLPVACTVLTGPGEFVLENPPPGTWYVLAHAVSSENEFTTHPAFSGEQDVSVGNHGPLVIGPGHGVRSADVRLTPVRPTDPPVLMAMLKGAPGTPG